MAGNIAQFVECFSGTQSPGFDLWCCIKLCLIVNTSETSTWEADTGGSVDQVPMTL